MPFRLIKRAPKIDFLAKVCLIFCIIFERYITVRFGWSAGLVRCPKYIFGMTKKRFSHGESQANSYISRNKHPKFPPQNSPKLGLTGWKSQGRPPCNAVNTKRLSFWCPVMMVTKCLDIVSKKTISGRKTAFLA